MAARKSSLRDLAAKSRKDGLAAANTGPVAGRIAELDPTLVHAGGLEDRIDISQEEIATLAESLRKAGQKVPILVRPHPSKPGEYEIVAGRRRLAACKIAGLQVRAEIQDLDDAALVMGQAIENIAREDLTYIERARLAARMVDEAGIKPADIDTAFSCGKTDRSRYLKIGRGIPDDILSFVGKAPGVGRPRWEKLVAHMEADEAAPGRMREELAAANTADDTLATSDARFSYLFDAAFRTDIAARTTAPRETEAKTPDGKEIWVPSHDTPVGSFKRTRSGVQMTLQGAFKPGFLDWLDQNVNAVIVQAMRDYERDTVFDDPAETSQDDGGEA
jgi:ParB family chromosome partitioning protein